MSYFNMYEDEKYESEAKTFSPEGAVRQRSAPATPYPKHLKGVKNKGKSSYTASFFAQYTRSEDQKTEL